MGDLFGIDERTDHVGVGLHGERVGLDGDGLRGSAHFHLYVGAQGARDVEDDALGGVFLKSLGRNLQGISSDVECGEGEKAGAIGGRCAGVAGAFVGEGDLGADDGAACRVSHDAVDLRVLLCMQRDECRQHQRARQ